MMLRPRIASTIRFASALATGAMGFTVAMNLLDTEAGGGRLTGPLIKLCLAASVTLVGCAVLVFTRRRIVSLVAVIAALCCLPLFVYRIAPSAMGWLSEAPSSVTSAQTLNPDPLAIVGVLSMLVLWTVYGRIKVDAPSSREGSR